MRVKEAPKKIGAIELPDSTKAHIENRALGIVLAVGPLVPKEYEGAEIKPGTVLAYDENRHQVIPDQSGLNNVFCRWGHCLGVVEDDPIPLENEWKEARQHVEDRQKGLQKEIDGKRAAASLVSGAGMALGRALRDPPPPGPIAP